MRLSSAAMSYLHGSQIITPQYSYYLPNKRNKFEDIVNCIHDQNLSMQGVSESILNKDLHSSLQKYFQLC